MSTKLLEQVRQQDQAALAAEHNGETRQPRRKWCVEALKDCEPPITEQQWFAATRAVEECGELFEGSEKGAGFQIYRDPTTGMLTSGTEQAALRDALAWQKLYGLRQAVSIRAQSKHAANCAEWIVQRHTLQDIAVEMGLWRRMGQGRDPIPDLRSVRPFVRRVLSAMADYYESCGPTKNAC